MSSKCRPTVRGGDGGEGKDTESALGEMGYEITTIEATLLQSDLNAMYGN